MDASRTSVSVAMMDESENPYAPPQKTEKPFEPPQGSERKPKLDEGEVSVVVNGIQTLVIIAGIIGLVVCVKLLVDFLSKN